MVTDLYDRNLELAKKYGATKTYKIDPNTDWVRMLKADYPDGSRWSSPACWRETVSSTP